MKNKRLIRIVAIVLVALLAGGVVFGALVSALSEEAAASGLRNRHELTMEYLEDRQALHITQRLLYVNASGIRLDGALFYAAGNMLRRESALMYEGDDLEAVFPEGYAPAGIDLVSVKRDGLDADYGFQGEDELYLRVACDLLPGETCAFEFEYYLLLARCGAFQGAGDTDVRLSAFYFAPAVWDAAYGEFALKKPLSYTRWLYCEAADFLVSLALPEGYEPASTGEASREDGVWRLRAENVREFALSFGRRYRAFEGETESGVRVRVLTNVRGAGRRIVDAAVDAIDRCEAWFGPFPCRELEFAQSDYPLGALNFPGLAWLPGALLASFRGEELAQSIRFCVAQQMFGMAAYTEPVADAWLSDALSEYVACLLLEDAAGRERFLKYVNRDWVSALGQTVPGGLNVSSDAALFDAYSYDIVVRKRGAVVLHELRLAMGREALLDGLAAFYGMGRNGRTLTEMDLVAALDSTGGSWEAFLTDWVFNVGEYVNQEMEWYE